jgi:hypothetical protein
MENTMTKKANKSQIAGILMLFILATSFGSIAQANAQVPPEKYVERIDEVMGEYYQAPAEFVHDEKWTLKIAEVENEETWNEQSVEFGEKVSVTAPMGSGNVYFDGRVIGFIATGNVIRIITDDGKVYTAAPIDSGLQISPNVTYEDFLVLGTFNVDHANLCLVVMENTEGTAFPYAMNALYINVNVSAGIEKTECGNFNEFAEDFSDYFLKLIDVLWAQYAGTPLPDEDESDEG